MKQDQIEQILRDFSYLAMPTLAFAILTAAIAVLLLRRAGVRDGASMFLTLAFATLGGIAGVITGSSMEALVGGLITGMLGVISAVLSYVFAKEADPSLRAIIALAIVLLMLNTLAGLSVGQNWKKKWITYSNQMEEHRLDYKELWIPATREYQKQVMERCFAENPKLADAAQHCRLEVLFPN